MALVGWCMVEESFKQTQARYQLAELAKKEDEMKKRLGVLRAKEEELRSPARLAALIRARKLDMVALGSIGNVAQETAAQRRPGEVVDDPTADRSDRDVNVASVGQW